MADDKITRQCGSALVGIPIQSGEKPSHFRLKRDRLKEIDSTICVLIL